MKTPSFQKPEVPMAISKKKAAEQKAKPILAQPKLIAQKPAQKPEKLSEKDQEILDNVESIIWNPDLLKQFQNDGKTKPSGMAKGKKAAK